MGDDNPLDNYNPFMDPTPKYETLANNNNNNNNVSGTRHPSMGDVNSFANVTNVRTNPNLQTNLVTNEAVLVLERKQVELEARAAELDRREQQEQQARINARHSNSAPHNWPPFPHFCPCKPCVRQDFETDIPFDCRWLAKMGYAIWIVYSLVLFLNMGGTLAYFLVGSGISEGPLFGASIFLFLVMPPMCFFFWHRPLYKALRFDSSTNYIIFFVMFSIQTVIVLIQCMGIDYFGSCGWFNAMRTVGINSSVAAFMFVIATLFTCLALASMFLLFKVHIHYRHSGASLRKAKLEMTSVAAYEATGFGAMP